MFLNKAVVFLFNMIYNIVIKNDIEIIFEKILTKFPPRVPLANALRFYCGIHREKLIDLAIELNKYRRTGSYPNYKMISTLVCIIPEEDVKRMVGHICSVRSGE